MPKRWVDIPLQSGMAVDPSLDTVPIAETVNLVSTPTGDAVEPREGSAIYMRFRPPGTPANRIFEAIVSQPPNLSDGTYLSVSVDNGGGGIRSLALIKPRTNLPGDTLDCSIYFDPGDYTADEGSTVPVTIKRSGALDRRVDVEVVSEDGSAMAWTDYASVNETLTFAPGETSKTLNVEILRPNTLTERWFSLTLQNPTVGVVIGSPGRASVGIGATADFSPIAFSPYGDTTVDVTFYRAASDSTVQRTLTGLTSGSNYRPMRVGVNYAGILEALPDGALKLHLYGLSAVSNGTVAPTRTVTILPSGGSAFLDYVKCYPYPGGIAYVTVNADVYKVVLESGEVTGPTAITGLASFNYADYGFFRQGVVSTDGYLLFPYSRTSSPYHALAKVNPRTGVATYVSAPQADYLVGHAALPNGEVHLNVGAQIGGPGGVVIKKFSSTLSTLTTLGTVENAEGYDDGIAINAAGKMIVVIRYGTPDDVAVVDALTGTVVGRTGRSQGGWITGQSTLSDTVFVHPDANTGEIVRISAATGAELGRTMIGNSAGTSFTPIPDAFAYNVQFLAGSL